MLQYESWRSKIYKDLISRYYLDVVWKFCCSLNQKLSLIESLTHNDFHNDLQYDFQNDYKNNFKNKLKNNKNK